MIDCPIFNSVHYQYMMQLFPAIDLRGGKVVRLTQGDYSRMTVYGEDPCAQARQFLTAGAKNLHVVDLDGAKDGTLSNYDTIAALAKQGRCDSSN